jgi:hypothetical protein
MHECKACGCKVGEGTKILPFRADDGGSYETFCPQCFVHVRAPLEPVRWDMRYFQAVHCMNCSTDQVAIGTLRCQNCNYTTGLLYMPPKADSA